MVGESLQNKQNTSATAIWQSSMDFVCTWDLGRRCNLDCTYCPPHRHNNWSPNSSLAELESTARLPVRYIQLLREKMGSQLATLISFTGGEPTLNPDFVNLCKYIKKEDARIDLGLTTNGLFNERLLHNMIGSLDHITLSLHFEAAELAKKKILENTFAIDDFYKKGDLKNYSVNVMVHAQDNHYEECLNVVRLFQEKGIRYSLRTIGEHPNDKSAHLYNEEQIAFIKSNGSKPKAKQAESDTASKTKHGSAAGRACCGGRNFKEIFDNPEGTFDNEWLSRQPDQKRLEWRRFKGWSCLVNLFFLHIQQEEKQVFYHQTCQAREDGTRGPIGSTDQVEELISFLESKFKKNNFQPVLCPNEICNCGLCITKSKDKAVLQKFLNANAPGLSLLQ